MSEHTPGPWEVSPPIKPGDGYNIPRNIVHKRPGRYYSVAAICGDWGGPTNWQANAALIARAPELLAFVEAVIEKARRGETFADSAMIMTGVDLIASAGGKTPRKVEAC